jgi:hypothetical protein
MDLIPAGEAGALAEFSCGATAVTIRGSELNPCPPTKWCSFGEAPFEQSALKLTTIQTSDEKIEVNTVV